MSFDPFGQLPDKNNPGPFPGEPPRFQEPSSPRPPSGLRDRVQLPGIVLLAVGLLNALVGLYTAFEAVRALVTPADKMYDDALTNAKRVGEAFPGLKDRLTEEMERRTPGEMKQQAIVQSSILTVALEAAAVVVVLGGIRMIQLRSYGLCLLASIVAATPCISPCGCCCVGNIAGLWALVVLLNPSVRMAFQ